MQRLLTAVLTLCSWLGKPQETVFQTLRHSQDWCRGPMLPCHQGDLVMQLSTLQLMPNRQLPAGLPYKR